jgi:hypothetical protein
MAVAAPGFAAAGSGLAEDVIKRWEWTAPMKYMCCPLFKIT